MSLLVRVSMVGFTLFEQQNFDACFRLTDQRGQAFVLTDRVADCRLAVVNADDDTAVAEVTRQGKLGCSLMLGRRQREGAAMQLDRPINLNQVLRALQALAQQEPPASRAVQRVLDDLAQVTAALAGHLRPREMAAAWAGGAGRVATVAPPRPRGSTPGRRGSPDHVLVVDREDAASRFIDRQLQGFGFQVQLARSAGEALERAAAQHFEWVFVDAALAIAKGCNLCADIHQLSQRRGTAASTVVVMAEPDTPVARLPGTGCDAYLLRPLATEALFKLVADREVARQAFAPTTHMASTLL